jgi:hypothetical protein
MLQRLNWLDPKICNCHLLAFQVIFVDKCRLLSHSLRNVNSLMMIIELRHDFMSMFMFP